MSHSTYCRLKKHEHFLTNSMYLLDVIEMSVGPVEFIISVVDGDPIGPLYLGGNDGRFVGSIHSNSAYKGFVPPVSPVHISKRYPRKISKFCISNRLYAC